MPSIFLLYCFSLSHILEVYFIHNHLNSRYLTGVDIPLFEHFLQIQFRHQFPHIVMCKISFYTNSAYLSSMPGIDYEAEVGR